jgi:hypothetical protein
LKINGISEDSGSKSNETSNETSNESSNSDESNDLDLKSNGTSNETSLKSNETSNDSEQKSKDNNSTIQRRISLTKKQKEIVNFCSVPRTKAEIMERLGLSNQKTITNVTFCPW